MWTFSQSTGGISHNGVHAGTGYAGGNKGANPEGVDNPSEQNIPRVGPLPRGFYTIEQPNNHIGPFSMPLTPDASNEMFGRSGFYIHGDNVERAGQEAGSEGCIVTGRATREAIWNSGDHRLEVNE